MHISSSHAKILGETNFHTREIPRSGSKAKDGERKKKKKKTERWNIMVVPVLIINEIQVNIMFLMIKMIYILYMCLKIKLRPGLALA